MKKLPSSCKVVVIGGGVIGCSVAYHLAKFGWKDTIILERDQLTSGTTWHAAGLVSQLGPSAAITKIRKYSLDLYKELEKKVDHSPGLRLNGALSIAQNKGRWQELQRQATTAQLHDVDVRILDKNQIKKEYPIINTDDVIDAAKDRQEYLAKIYDEKCSENSNIKSVSKSIENELNNLKRMHAKGLITDEEYKAARKKALGL